MNGQNMLAPINPLTELARQCQYFQEISRPGSGSPQHQPIRGQHPGHVITLDESEASIQGLHSTSGAFTIIHNGITASITQYDQPLKYK